MIPRSRLTLFDRNVGGGTYSVTWNGRDAQGQPVSPGVCYVRLESLNGVSTGKLVHVR